MSSAGFKVKISDGSIVGPLDAEMVQSWYEQGLINGDTPVLAPASRKWQRLRDVAAVEGGGKGGSRGPALSIDDSDEVVDSDRPARGARVTAGGLLILGAAGTVAGLLAPQAWRSDLAPVPWLEIGLVLLLLGLTALHESEWARKLARAGVGLAAFALFPVAGIVIAKGVPLDGLAVLVCAWLAASGLFFMLSPSLSFGRLLATAAVVLVGAYGIVRFGVVMGGAAAASSGSNWFAALPGAGQ